MNKNKFSNCHITCKITSTLAEIIVNREFRTDVNNSKASTNVNFFS